jgi:hypothetical protein
MVYPETQTRLEEKRRRGKKEKKKGEWITKVVLEVCGEKRQRRRQVFSNSCFLSAGSST